MKSLITLMALWITMPLPESDWEKSIDQVKSAFIECTKSSSGCEAYTFQALEVVYPDQSSFDFTDNHSFYSTVKSANSWELLGAAYSQPVLSAAQKHANEGHAVVAIYLDKNDEPLHIAVILPGELQNSGSWGMLVPQAVSLPDFNPDNAFTRKPLSYAFEKRALLSLKIFALK